MEIYQSAEKEVCQFLRAEELLNTELKHGHYDNFFDSEEEWLEYELEKLREYITDYINGNNIQADDLYPIKEFIQHLKFQRLLDRYDDLYSMDMFGESLEGHKYKHFSIRETDKSQLKRRYGTVTGGIKE